MVEIVKAIIEYEKNLAHALLRQRHLRNFKSFPDTEIAEYDIKQILNVDLA